MTLSPHSGYLHVSVDGRMTLRAGKEGPASHKNHRLNLNITSLSFAKQHCMVPYVPLHFHSNSRGGMVAT